jgi:hypothetical protein
MPTAKLVHNIDEPIRNVGCLTFRSSSPARPAEGGGAALPNPSRRAMLAGSTAALLAGAAIATGARGAPAEAQLARLLAQLKRDHAAVLAVVEEGHHLPEGITPASEDQEQRLAEAMDVREATAEVLPDIHVHTMRGLQTKAAALIEVLAIYLPLTDNVTFEELAAGEGELHPRMALSLAYDVLAWRATA